MNKITNFFYLIVIIIFFFNIINYYFSDINVKNININRSNIDNIIKKQVSNLTVLKSDTSDAIEFNSSFSEEIKNSKPRSFWNLLKSK